MPDTPLPGPPDDFGRAERMLESAATPDAARQTLGWALERVRSLEKAHAQALELLKKSETFKETASAGFDALRRSLETREQTLAHKERLAEEMEATLKGIFQHKIDLKDLQERPRELEAKMAELESSSRQRLHELEERRRRELEEHARRVSELETAYGQALDGARKRYQDELTALDQSRQKESLELRERESRFKEDITRQVRQQGDELQKKLLAAERELADRRHALQREYDQLKARLVDDSRQRDSGPSFAVRVAESRWLEERRALEAELKVRDEELKRLRAQSSEMRPAAELEARAARRAEERLRGEYDLSLRSLGESHQQELDALSQRLEQAAGQAATLRETLDRESQRTESEVRAVRERYAHEAEALRAEFQARLKSAEEKASRPAARSPSDGGRIAELEASLAAAREEAGRLAQRPPESPKDYDQEAANLKEEHRLRLASKTRELEEAQAVLQGFEETVHGISERMELLRTERERALRIMVEARRSQIRERLLWAGGAVLTLAAAIAWSLLAV